MAKLHFARAQPSKAGCQLAVSGLDTIMTNGGTRSSDENSVVRE